MVPDPAAPLDGGVSLWRNFDPAHGHDWMTAREYWQLVDRFGNVFNRLLLMRGDLPHSGAAGWGDGVANGRLFQTFFFKILPSRHPVSVRVPVADGAGHAG